MLQETHLQIARSDIMVYFVNKIAQLHVKLDVGDLMKYVTVV